MELKFVCLNAWHGERLEHLVDFLKVEEPDVVALQEVTSCAAVGAPWAYRLREVLVREFPKLHSRYAPAYEDRGLTQAPVVDGNLVLSRFSIGSARVAFFDVPYGAFSITGPPGTDWTKKPRNYQSVEVKLPDGGDLLVVNTQGIWGFDGEDNPRRLRMAEQLSAACVGRDRVVLCGDMNVKDTTRAAALMRRGLTDVFGPNLASSFGENHRRGGGFAAAVVDMVLVGPGVRVLGASVPPADVTDHVPLVCRLEL